MSLLAWYPLVENGSNYGLDGIDLITSGTVEYTSGKLGKAPTFVQNASNKLYRTSFRLKDKFSWACWVKLSATESTAQQFIVSEGRDVGSLGINLRCNQSGLIFLSCSAGTINIATVTHETWHHIVITVDSDDKIRAYIDGVEQGTPLNYRGIDYREDNSAFLIGKMSYGHGGTTTYFPFCGQIQDVRVYNHVLSKREIKELSKGLVIHYELKGEGTNPNLARGSLNLLNSNDRSTFFNHTVNKINGETINRFTCINNQFNYDNDGTWISGLFNKSYGAVVNTQYTWSFDARASKNIPLNFGHEWFGMTTNNQVTTEWKHFKGTGIYKPGVEGHEAFMITTNKNNWEVNLWLEIKNFKIEEGSVDTSYIPHVDEEAYSVISTNNTTEYNVVGYPYNATKVGTTTSTSSPKYSNSTYFDNNDYINMGTAPGYFINNKPFSFSVWVRSLENNSRGIIFSSYQLPSTAEFVAFELHPRGNNAKAFRFDWKQSLDYFTDNIFDLDTWVHLVCTCDGSVVKIYKNGTMVHTYTLNLPSVTEGNVWYLGKDGRDGATAFNGYMSDFRLYTTVLSETDVKELYNLSASVDDKYNLLTRELNESNQTQITSKSTIASNLLENSGVSTYEIVGTLTNNNGVFSGFSNSNYMKTNCYISANTKNLVIHGSYTTGNDIDSCQHILCTAHRNISFDIMDKHFRLFLGNTGGNTYNTSIVDTYTISPNTKYYYKLVFNGSTAFLYLLLDNVWSQRFQLSVADGIYHYGHLLIGIHCYSNLSGPVLGSIDLKDISIVVDQKEIWNGQEALLNQRTPYTIIGSPTISANNVVSNLSLYDYLTVPNFSLGDSTWDMYLTFITSNVNTHQGVLSCSSGYTFGLAISESKFYVSFGNGSSFSIGEITNITLQANTTYNIKISFDGTKYTCSFLESGSYVVKGTITSSTKLPTNLGTLRIGLHRANTSTFLGSVDLKKFIVKSNNKVIWSGNTSFIEQKEPYTIVGTVNIDDGIASNFSSSNYIKLIDYPPPIQNYEIGVKFYINNWGSDSGRIIGNQITNVKTPQIETPNSGRASLDYLHPSSSSEWQRIVADYTINKNVWYWLKAIWNGTVVTLYLSNNGTVYTNCGTYTTSTCGWTQPFEIGYDIDVGAFDGKVDLKETYVKINNIMFWEGNLINQGTKAKIGSNYITAYQLEEF